jgi:DNA-binding MarR family transcriptional regulator
VRSSSKLSLADYLPYRLSVAAAAVSALVAKAYEERFGLPIPQWRIIAILMEHKSLTQQQLVPLSTMDKQTISRAARSLQARGLIGRVTSSQDRRAYRLKVTASGRRLYRAVVPLALSYERLLLSNLSARQISILRRQLRQLEQAAAAAAGRNS